MVRLTHQICSLILMAVVLPINAQDVDWVITSPNEAYDYSQVDITFASANTIAQVQLTGDEGGLTLVSFQDNAIKLLTPIVFQDTVFAYALTITDSANNTATFEKTMLVKIYEHPLDAFNKLSTIFTENFITDDYAVFNFSFDAVHTAELYTEIDCYEICSDRDGYFSSDLHNGMWGDFNGDGHEDFVATWAVFPSGLERDGTSTLSNIEIYLNNGEGRLIRNREIYLDGVPPSSHFLYRIAVADFNKDGIDDIFSVASGLNQRGVDGENIKRLVYPHALLLSTPEGKFRDASSDIEGNAQAPCDPHSAACSLFAGHNAASGDINGDGYPDLSIGHKLYLNENGEKFVDVTDQLPSEWENTNIYTGPMTTEIKDFNNDGFGDLVMFWFDMAHLDDPPDPEILLSNGTANISEWTRHTLPIGYFGDGLTKFNNKFSGDIDGDGDLDMVTNTTRTNPSYYRGRFIQVLINDGNGNFTDKSFEALGDQPRSGDYGDPDYTHFCNAHGEGSIFLRDYDGDGDLDIIDVAPGGSGPNGCTSPSIFLNNGSGVFSELAFDLAWVQETQVEGWETWQDSGALRPPTGKLSLKAYPLNLDNKNKLDFVSSWRVPAQGSGPLSVDNIIHTYQIMSVSEWPSPFNGVTPDSSLGLAFNNIGVFNATDSTIYACLRLFTDGSASSTNGISQFDIGLKVVSLSEATVQITKYREFNTIGALNENVELPDCSGKFETTTGVYTDIIQVGTSVLDTTWSLIDSTNLILKLSSYQELTAN